MLFRSLGKAALCLSALSVRDEADPEGYAEAFWTAFRAHKTKGELAHFAVRVFGIDTPLPLFEELSRELIAAAQSTDERKFRSLYVDIAADDSVLTPTDITEAEARAITDQLGLALTVLATDGLGLADAGKDPNATAEIFRQIRAATTGAQIAHAVGGWF